MQNVAALTLSCDLNKVKILRHFINAGALGVMFEYGIGVEQNIQSAFECLKGAAIRGNVYSQGNLAVHYYKRKLFNKAADVAKRLVVLILPEKLTPYCTKSNNNCILINFFLVVLLSLKTLKE
jgi:hypothetical protein